MSLEVEHHLLTPSPAPVQLFLYRNKKREKKIHDGRYLTVPLKPKKKNKNFFSLSLFVCQVKGKEKPKHFYLYLSRVFLYVRISFKVRRRHKKEESRQQSNQVALYTQDVYPKKKKGSGNQIKGTVDKGNGIKSNQKFSAEVDSRTFGWSDMQQSKAASPKKKEWKVQ